jgi:hypothetical protein
MNTYIAFTFWKIGLRLQFSKKLPIVNSHQKGEKSPDLVTLLQIPTNPYPISCLNEYFDNERWKTVETICCTVFYTRLCGTFLLKEAFMYVGTSHNYCCWKRRTIFPNGIFNHPYQISDLIIVELVTARYEDLRSQKECSNSANN